MTVGRTSFAFDGVGGQWAWYHDDHSQRVPIDEILQHMRAVRAADGEIAAYDFRELVRAKLKLAEQGHLQIPGDGRPSLVRADGVMELKWRIRRTEWRLYYCEPLGLRSARVMLGLHFNRKDTLGQQDADIDEAARRWRWWQERNRD